ncbi:MAG: hypothetical protein ABIT04_04780 [Novosphingobium sp.]
MALKRSSYWQHVQPVGAVADFITVFKQAGANRWRIAVLAATATIATFSMLWTEEYTGPPRRPNITYITSFAPGRSDAEIVASNLANQKLQDRLAAEQAQREEKVREIYKSIGRASGMDVDAIEREALADRAGEQRGKTQEGAASEPQAKPAAEAPAR